jgi:hypothetical protein
MLSVVEATPIPPSHEFGGCEVTPRVEGRSAAENMNPSKPGVRPVMLGWGRTRWT